MSEVTAESILAAYQKANQAPEKGTSTYKKENYFNTSLSGDKSIKEGKKIIRILPGLDSLLPFFIIHRHQLLVDGKQVSTICPKKHPKEGETGECPICDAAKILWDKSKEAGIDDNKKKALQTKAGSFTAKEAHVYRVIDRAHEDEGVKLWIVNKDRTGKGNTDKIMSLIENKGNITDIEKGRDVCIPIKLVPNAQTKKESYVVQGLIHEDISPLSTDKEKIEKWLNDKTSWKSFIGTKPFSWLKVVSLGYTPLYDSASKQFIAKEDSYRKEDELEVEVNSGLVSNDDDIENISELPTMDGNTSNDEDDLPF